MWRIWLLGAAEFLGSIAVAALLLSLLLVAAHPPHGAWLFVTDVLGQFLRAVAGDFGHSTVTGTPAITAALRAAPVTAQHIAAGAVLALFIGIPLGLLLSGGRTLRMAAPLLQIVTAIPVFLVALALAWAAIRTFHMAAPAQPVNLHPANSSMTALLRGGDWNGLWFAYFLPVLTIGAAGAARLQLSLRRAAGVAWAAPYRNGLRMMGLSLFDINLRFALPEIAAALLRDLQGFVLTLISAAVIAEWIFQSGGAAELFLKASARHDWAVVSSILFLASVLTLAAGFLGKVLASLIVPEEAA
jgi:peptide/nickel transport system permease protein